MRGNFGFLWLKKPQPLVLQKLVGLEVRRLGKRVSDDVRIAHTAHAARVFNRQMSNRQSPLCQPQHSSKHTQNSW
jgi:hypothetical protein